MSTENGRRLGWVGAGRMGHALAGRLLAAGHDVAVFNRTRAKAESLETAGATVVDAPAELADREVVFTMVAGPDDFKEVVLGPSGVLAANGSAPSVIVDMTTVSPDASQAVRDEAAERGVALIAAPVSGNPKVVAAGRVTMVASGPQDAFDRVAPLLGLLGAGVTYVGEGENARLAKICHNLMLGVVAQCMAEITVLAEKGGMSRAAFLDFLNNSVMGSMFTRYKTPAYVNLDLTPTFTPLLLRKDFDLGLAAARELDVPMPVAAAAMQTIQALIGSGHTDEDFAALLVQQARASGLELVSENADIDEGLVVR
jgi:3-hydroxyisobutyrate dehydrogenase